MQNQIPPYVLIFVGVLMWASYYVIGGFVGSAIAVIGFLLFLFGVAGLFRRKK